MMGRTGKFALAALGIVLLIVLVEVILGQQAQKKAGRLVARISELPLEKATLSEFEKISREVGLPLKMQGQECSAQYCSFYIAVDNSHLSFWGLAPETVLYTGAAVTEGHPERITTVYKTRYNDYGAFAVVIRERPPLLEGEDTFLRREPFSVDRMLRDDVLPWHAFVELTPESSAAQKKTAFQFNLKCLSKIGGCKSSEEMAPEIWRMATTVKNLDKK